MKCNNCGNELIEGSRFCTGCGTPVSNENTNGKMPNQPYVNGQQVNGQMPNQAYANGQQVNGQMPNQSYVNGQQVNGQMSNQPYVNSQQVNGQMPNQPYVNSQQVNGQMSNQQCGNTQQGYTQMPTQQSMNMQTSHTQMPTQIKNKKRRNIIIAMSAVLVVIVACVAVYMHYKSSKDKIEQEKVAEETTKVEDKQEDNVENPKVVETTTPIETPMKQRESVNVDITAIDNSEFPKVTLYFSVRNLEDEFLDTVLASRLSVYEKENGGSEDWEQVQTFMNYQGKQGDSKKSVAFVMDTSGSMEGSLEAECAAADVLLDRMEQDGNYSVAFTAFSTEQHDWLDYTRDYSDFREYMSDLSADGETAFYDTLENTLQHALYQNGQKYILAFTDGEDTNSTTSGQEVLEMAKAYKIPIYIITMSDIDNSYLSEVEEIAENSGGGLYTIDTIEDLKNIYYDVFELQSKQYSLTYESTQTGGYSDIRLQLVSDEYEGGAQESFYAEKPKHYYAKPKIEEIKASSECKPMTDSNQKKCTYGAENVYDGDNRTAWVEGKADDGVGEYLKIKLKEKSSVNGILISNGYYKNTDVYYRNNRVKKVKLTFSDGSSKVYKLEDNFLETCDIQFDEPVVTSTIKVEILSVYKSKSLNGKKAYHDTCITELEVY